MSRFFTRTRQDIREIQLKLLQQQLAHCARSVPYYQQQFAEYQLNPQDFRDISQLERLPMIDKALVRDQALDFRSAGHLGTGVHQSFSSGSTGEPFASYFDKRAWWRKKYLVKLRARFACGMRARQRVAILECEEQSTVKKRNRNNALGDAFLKVRVFSLFQDPENLVDALRRFRPHNIYAYPSHLLELASATEETPVLPGLERLFTSSEFLEAGSRSFIEERFDVPIFDHYGSTEFKEVAFQCSEKNWYHVNYDEVHVEVVDDQNRPIINQPGSIVVTDLRNKAMPLIRFHLGDLGVLSNSPCICGYRGDSMKPLGGRSSDYLELPNGETISPYRVTTEIENIAGLLQYQLIQQSPNRIAVRTVWRETPDPPAFDRVEQAIRQALVQSAVESDMPDISINVERCARIDNEENGKFKVVKRLF